MITALGIAYTRIILLFKLQICDIFAFFFTENGIYGFNV